MVYHIITQFQLYHICQKQKMIIADMTFMDSYAQNHD